MPAAAVGGEHDPYWEKRPHAKPCKSFDTGEDPGPSSSADPLENRQHATSCSVSARESSDLSSTAASATESQPEEFQWHNKRSGPNPPNPWHDSRGRWVFYILDPTELWKWKKGSAWVGRNLRGVGPYISRILSGPVKGFFRKSPRKNFCTAWRRLLKVFQ